MTYELTVTDNQMRVLEIALESYVRVRMGQFFDLANDISGVDERGLSQDAFVLRITKRNALQDSLDGLYRFATPHELLTKRSADSLTAQDIWAVIRHERYMDRPKELRSSWCTAADKPLLISDDPRVKVRRVKE